MSDMHISSDIEAQILESLNEKILSYMFPGIDPAVLFKYDSGDSMFRHMPEDRTGASAGDGCICLSRGDVTHVERDFEARDLEAEERSNEILRAVEKIVSEFDISLDDLETILAYRVKNSRLKISDSYRIVLMDYGFKEVLMEPLTKTVFLLFLSHPEGIILKDIPDYRREIEELYNTVTRRSSTENLKKSIDRLCNVVEENSINEKISRVKRAFCNQVDGRIAKNYYIDGVAGGRYGISLPRELVIWG